MLKITVTGAGGKMGRQIVSLIAAAKDLKLAGALEHGGYPRLGADAGEVAGVGNLGVVLSKDVSATVKAADVTIDFSQPEATLGVAKEAAAAGKRLVIGTTGHEPKVRAEILKTIEKIPVVWAPNMAVGVNVLFKLAGLAAKILGEDYDIEVVEMHHRHKKDAPSGTALRLGQVVAEARGKNLEKDGVFSRHGNTGARVPGSIGMQTLRGGDAVGDHTVMFAAEGERLEITHRATSRENFARGAVLAARWLPGKKSGLYGMEDVLGLK